MKKIGILALVCLAPLLTLQAQLQRENSSYSAYYRLTPDEARKFYLKKNAFDTTWLQTLVGTDDKIQVQNLPPGHYLSAMARQECIAIEMYTVYPINLFTLNTKRGLAFTLTDSTGRPITDAIAEINGKKVHFNPKLQCYLLKKWRKDGRLLIETQGNVWLYEVEKLDSERISIKQQRISRRMAKPLGRLLVRSGYIARSARYSFHRYNYNQNPFYNWIHRRENKLNARRQFNGYIAFSQPQYRPGDTLKVKAWLETRKGKAWNKPIDLEVFDMKSGRKVIKTLLQPVTPGHFEYTMPIADSLLIDRNYQFTFFEPKPPVKGIFRRYQLDAMRMSNQVYLEDYVLDEVTYTFTSKKTAYLRSDSVVFHLKARDGNDKPIPDGRYVLTVTKTNINRFDAPEVFVPDTLWRTEGVLPMSGDLDIYLPKEFIPAAGLNVEASVNCYTSSGELQNKTLSVVLGDTPSDIVFALKKDWLHIDWQNKNIPPPVVRLTETRSQSNDRVSMIQLPARIKLDASLYAYYVLLGQNQKTFDFNNHKSNISVTGTQTGDTVFFVLENPHLQPVRYTIYRDGNQHEEGVTHDSLWVKKIRDPEGHNYFLKYTYIWGGEPYEGSGEVKYFDKLLKVNVEQPLSVVPGESVQVKVKVTDQHDKPIKSADLTSGSVNTLFGEKLPYSNPRITGRRRADPLSYTDLAIEEADEPTATLPLSEKWYNLFQLDKNPYYRIRHLDKSGQPPVKIIAIPVSPNAFLDEYGRPAVFPDQAGGLPGIPPAKDSFYLKKPQFAPFIINDYKSRPVYMVWVNERLVYYYGTTDQQPYSFFGEPGKNNIRIRTGDGEFAIDSVIFKAGTKYLIALSETYFKQSAAAQPQMIGSFEPEQARARVRFSPKTKNMLNAFEKNYLQQSIFSVKFNNYRHREIYTWASGYDIHRMTDNRLTYLVGPFPTRCLLNFMQTDGFLTSFEFEPGFDYEISPGRERLYHNKNAWLSEKLPADLPKKSINDWALGPHHIRKTSVTQPQYVFATPEWPKKGNGTLQIAFYSNGLYLKGSALKGDQLAGPFLPTNTTWGLKPGRYTLILFANDGKTAKKQVEIRRDTLTFINLSGIKFGEPLPQERFDSLFHPVDRSPEIKKVKTAPIPAGYGDSYFGGIIEGVVKDESGEVLIGAAVRLVQGNVFIKGGITNIEGRYQITGVPQGVYAVEISYTGFGVEREEGVLITDRLINYLDFSMQSARMLDEVVVSALGVSRVSQDAVYRSQLSGSVLQDIETYSLSGKVFGANISYRLKDELTYDYDDEGLHLNFNYNTEGPEEKPAEPTPRSNFKDHAFFQTNLSTDENGEAVFTATYPDNITGWKTYAMAAGGKGRFGLGNTFTRSFKPLTAQLAVPRFAVAGDRFDVAGRVSNYTDDSVRLETRFRLNRQEISGKSVRIGPGWSEKASIEVPATGTDSLSVEYEALSGKNTDGELRKIEVIPAGTMETSGDFLLLENDTTVQFQADPAHGPVTFYAQNNVLDLLLSDVEYLYNYPYGCNEQTASRLVALLSLKKIKAMQRQPFLYEKDIYACLKRLKNNQLADGTWGWWQNSTSNIWMTVYVADALQKARQSGYEAAGLEPALSVVQLRLPAMPFRDQQNALTMLRNSRVNIDCKPFVATLDSMERRWRDHSLSYKLHYWRLRQLCGDKVERDSLTRYLQRTTFGGIYCGPENTHWYDRRAMLTLLAYDIAQTAGWTDITAAIRRYWLETRKEQRNTLETAQILERTLPAILNNPAATQPVRLTVGQMQYDSFPVRVELAPERNQSITISKSGGSTVFANIYQQWHNPDPQPRSDVFEVKTRLLNAEDQRVTSLKFGESATLEVTVKVKAAAEYVMIEAPIPAGCGYGAKIQPWGPEVHREYFKDKTAIFCEAFPVGDYTFRIPLEARFTGTFTLNPAKVEQMYFPVFFGRNAVESVRIR